MIFLLYRFFFSLFVQLLIHLFVRYYIFFFIVPWFIVLPSLNTLQNSFSISVNSNAMIKITFDAHGPPNLLLQSLVLINHFESHYENIDIRVEMYKYFELCYNISK